jgi:haloalkane dehalogenase
MLDLRDITLMVQDWGGPIGLHAAARAPERYQALIIGDTRAWPGLPAFERIQSCFMASPLGAYLARKHNLYADLLIPLGHRRRTLSRAELDHYRQPLTSTAARERARRLAGALTDNQPFLAEVERGLARLAHLPALLVWAEHDPGFPRADRERFERIFPRHHTVLLKGAGHFIQDDAPDLIVEALRPWWRAHVRRVAM